jgi:hypothetical protein
VLRNNEDSGKSKKVKEGSEQKLVKMIPSQMTLLEKIGL